MKRMFDDTVVPRILAQAGGGARIRQLVMKFFGTGESDMEQRLGEMISRSRQPRVGITVSDAFRQHDAALKGKIFGIACVGIGAIADYYWFWPVVKKHAGPGEKAFEKHRGGWEHKDADEILDALYNPNDTNDANE